MEHKETRWIDLKIPLQKGTIPILICPYYLQQFFDHFLQLVDLRLLFFDHLLLFLNSFYQRNHALAVGKAVIALFIAGLLQSVEDLSGGGLFDFLCNESAMADGFGFFEIL